MPEPATHPSDRPPMLEDMELVQALRRGDEAAFVGLVQRYGGMMLGVAMNYVRSRAVAEEVVQDTWCALLTGIDRFEGRSSFKTWLFRILVNRAMTKGQREARCAPFSTIAVEGEDDPVVPPDQFLPADHPTYPGHWAARPTDWRRIPEERLLGKETVGRVRAAIALLPPRQRDVLVLRDVEGWSSDEVCEALHLTEGNQRVLLHRARSRVRAELDRYFGGEAVAT